MFNAILMLSALLTTNDFVITTRPFVITERPAPAAEAAAVRPTLIFWTQEHCLPCRQMEPHLADLRAAGWNVQVVDINRTRGTGIGSTPTMEIQMGGERIGNRKVGVWSAASLMKTLEDNVQGTAKVSTGTVQASPKRTPSLWNRPGSCYESRQAMIEHLAEDGIHRGTRSRAQLEAMSDLELRDLHESQHRANGDVVVNGWWRSKRGR